MEIEDINDEIRNEQHLKELFKEDEIKEILDRLNENKNEIKTYCYYPDDVLSCDELIKLLDYITDLQEELEYQKQAENEYNEKHLKLMNMYSDLKSKCEKALDKLYCYGEVFDRKILQDFQKEMIDILGDGDKE